MGEADQVETEETRQQSKQNHAEAQTRLLAALGFPQDLSEFVHWSGIAYLLFETRRRTEAEADEEERRNSEESGEDSNPKANDKTFPE